MLSLFFKYQIIKLRMYINAANDQKSPVYCTNIFLSKYKPYLILFAFFFQVLLLLKYKIVLILIYFCKKKGGT